MAKNILNKKYKTYLGRYAKSSTTWRGCREIKTIDITDVPAVLGGL
ncbi:hypothetical protein QYQ99_18010 [Comamonas testosteroni]|nr:hypothetical protein [Comamonas testosteroni]WKL14300.1 hypothetical protein QYQ99_18010 [Comamonas testosteroni]